MQSAKQPLGEWGGAYQHDKGVELMNWIGVAG